MCCKEESKAFYLATYIRVCRVFPTHHAPHATIFFHVAGHSRVNKYDGAVFGKCEEAVVVEEDVGVTA